MRAGTRRLIGVIAIGFALGATAMPASAGPPAPRNVVPPVVLGVPATGQTLGYYQGFWTLGGTPYVFTQQWLRCDLLGGNCVGTGVTTPTYFVSSADVGHTIRVRVTNTGDNGGGQSTTADSPPTAPVVR
jgi:hypothetical protein